jgi:hypothetical protein
LEKIELKKKRGGKTSLWNSSTRKNDQIIPPGCAPKKKEAASGPPLTERFINEQIIIRERETYNNITAEKKEKQEKLKIFFKKIKKWRQNTKEEEQVLHERCVFRQSRTQAFLFFFLERQQK